MWKLYASARRYQRGYWTIIIIQPSSKRRYGTATLLYDNDKVMTWRIKSTMTNRSILSLVDAYIKSQRKNAKSK